MSLFGHQFYPTPKELAFQLFNLIPREHWLAENRRRSFPRITEILEPSAGKGDLINHLESYYEEVLEISYHSSPREYDVCEIDLDLAQMLSDYRVVGTDFLEYKDYMYYHLIVMNPPFSEGVHHVLHAYDNLQGGFILAILNAETIRNEKDQYRKRLNDIISKFGNVVYVEAAFTSAERTTDVEVALVQIYKSSTRPEGFEEFERAGFDKEDVELGDLYEVEDSQGLQMKENKLHMLERLYNEATEKFKRALIEYSRLSNHITALGAHGYAHNEDKSPMSMVGSIDLTNPSGFAMKHKQFLKSLKRNAWNNLLDNSKFKNRLDSRTRGDFEKFLNGQGNMAFTAKNMMSVFEMIITNQGLYQQKAIETAFDFMTSFSSGNLREENITRELKGEGWKTNDAFQVKKKCILPYGIRFDRDWYNKGYSANFGLSYHHDTRSAWNDIDKAMCVVAGISPEYLNNWKEGHEDQYVKSIGKALKEQFDAIGSLTKPAGKFDNKCESTFFKMKFYMTGTVHLEWKDQKILDRFNRLACEGKGWLKPAENTKQADPDESQLVTITEEDYLF